MPPVLFRGGGAHGHSRKGCKYLRASIIFMSIKKNQNDKWSSNFHCRKLHTFTESTRRRRARRARSASFPDATYVSGLPWICTAIITSCIDYGLSGGKSLRGELADSWGVPLRFDTSSACSDTCFSLRNLLVLS